MPKRKDIESILIIGAGPIVIGQACEFDYSGTQACRVLKDEGYRVILCNSNPATIMTDPDFADATYIEPVEWQTLAAIIALEKPDVILPTMGGQTAINATLDLIREGVIDDTRLIGASSDALEKAENRELFNLAMARIGLHTAKSGIANNLEEAKKIVETTGFPAIIRPSFTLGGSGSGIAYNPEQFTAMCRFGLEQSPTHQILIDQSLIGWKEYEMEVVRDCEDNAIIVCSIENFDPMGVHTGDSITVAPAQTLTDKEYQLMRNASLAVLREIGVETGGSNVQFAINPDNGDMIVIEMNPRVSRSSALASKATGFPIAKIAAQLAVGYTLNELGNKITNDVTPASFEPSIDYVVTKIPRFTFEKFGKADQTLSTQMKSVGEAMAIGGTFAESLNKALRSLETGATGLDPIIDNPADNQDLIRKKLAEVSDKRLWYIADAFRAGLTSEEIFNLTWVDPWFLSTIELLVNTEGKIVSQTLEAIDHSQLFSWKQLGFSDKRLAQLLGVSEQQVRHRRQQLDLQPVYKRIDTCAGEFPTETAYLYSTYAQQCEAQPDTNKKIVILGGGPNRIGQGIEFDYCCVHASLALSEAGYETIMVNCNPETVSTDFDISDRLYFEPVTLEDVLAIVRTEKPDGVIVQFGGQTPLRMALELEHEGVPIIGISPSNIDRTEDRDKFRELADTCGLLQPRNGVATSLALANAVAEDISYPIVVRPSYVLGGRAMEIVYDAQQLATYITEAVQVSNNSPVLLDSFLDGAIEIDIDAISDGKRTVIGGIMEHIEHAGIHSGDSACSLPARSLTPAMVDKIQQQVEKIAAELHLCGLINMQMAIKDEQLYMIEVNPRASRTVPFVSKATGVPLAKYAALTMVGVSLEHLGLTETPVPPMHCVKEVVLPWAKFPGVDPLLGPEMKSTGEVMGFGKSFVAAFSKAMVASGSMPSLTGSSGVFISVCDQDKIHAASLARSLSQLGFIIYTTTGTALAIGDGTPVITTHKIREAKEPNITQHIRAGSISLIINTVDDQLSTEDSHYIRKEGLIRRVPIITTIEGALALCESLKIGRVSEVYKLQSLF